jgi:predicted NBD/HSP70 family sugar kinase
VAAVSAAELTSADGQDDEAPPLRLVAGVDIGGSKVLAVAMDERRYVRARVRLRTTRGAKGVVESAARAVDALAGRLGEARATPGRGTPALEVVGVGVPGLVEPGTGRVSHAVNLGLRDEPIDLGASLATRLGLPVVVENDVNVAAVGAARLLGLEGQDLAYLSIGTGLAAGIVTAGQLRRGARGAAGEIGHVPVEPAGPLCRCGQRGCLETLASGSAIAAAWPVADGRSAANALFDAADAGDLAAVAVRDRFADHVAAAVRLLVLTCDVETVVLGGGVTDLGVRLMRAVTAALRHAAATAPFLAALDLPARVRIIPPRSDVAALGAAIVGAASVVPRAAAASSLGKSGTSGEAVPWRS